MAGIGNYRRKGIGKFAVPQTASGDFYDRQDESRRLSGSVRMARVLPGLRGEFIELVKVARELKRARGL